MKSRKILTFAISIALSLSTSAAALPAAELAASYAGSGQSSSIDLYGKCGADATYRLSADGTLIIRGNGKTDQTDELSEIISQVKAIVIDEGITEIGSGIFSGAANMVSLTLAESVEVIGEKAFSGAAALKELYIPASVKSIGSSAFCGCDKLEKAVIFNPECEFYDDVTTIGGSYDEKTGTCPLNGYIAGFTGSTAEAYAKKYDKPFKDLEKTAPEIITKGSCGTNADFTFDTAGLLTVTAAGEGECSIDVFFNELLVDMIRKVVIGDGITDIGIAAFCGCDIKEITIPDSVISIGDSAFSGCPSLTSVVIPDNVKSLGNYSFAGCRSLTSVTIPDSVEEIGTQAFGGTPWFDSFCEEYPIAIINGTLIDGHNCKEKDVTIPDGVKVINANAFNYNADITSVTIPDSVTTIKGGAFLGCEALSSVAIPPSVTTIEPSAFAGTQFLAECQEQDPLVVINGILIDGSVCKGDVVIPDGVTSVVSSAFSCNNDITSVTFPDSVTSIGADAFGNCTSLRTVRLSKSLTKIEQVMFNSCSALESADIPESVEEICASAFSNCSSLETVVIPKSVKEIGEYAFGNCENLTELTIMNPSCIIPDNNDVIFNSGKYTYEGDYVNIFTGTIKGCRGSTAEKYARKYAIEFEALPDKKGDLNSDGKTDAVDASAVLVYYSAMSTGGEGNLTSTQIASANVNGDEMIDAKDATCILSYYSYVSTGGSKSIEEFLAPEE